MKTLLTVWIAAFFIAGGFVNAQDNDKQSGYDPKAKEILDELSKNTKSYTTIKAKFIYSMDDKANDIHEEQNGTLILKGDKYKLDIAGQEIISDGKVIWTHLKEEEEVQIADAEYEENALNPATIFTIYEKGFKYRYIGEEQHDGQSVYVIDLVPEESKTYSRIRLMVNKEKNRIVSSKMFGKEGTDYTYIIKEFKPNMEFNDNFFIFDKAKNPGVEIIDLRDSTDGDD